MINFRISMLYRCQMQLCPPCNTVRSGHFCICNRVRGHGQEVYQSIFKNHLCKQIDSVLPRRLTRSAINGSQIFDSHKCPTVLVRKVKGKQRHFEANLCGSLFSTFKTSFYNHMHVITNGYKRLLQTNSSDPRQRVPLSCCRVF